MDMKTRIYLLSLLCVIYISHPLFAGKDRDTQHTVTQLIQQQIQEGRNANEAWHEIRKQVPHPDQLRPGLQENFLLVYALWKISPKAFAQSLGSQ